jgi:hypothetical protein
MPFARGTLKDENGSSAAFYPTLRFFTPIEDKGLSGFQNDNLPGLSNIHFHSNDKK